MPESVLLAAIPLLNPTIMLVLVLSTIGGFSLFIEPYVMTGGGPGSVEIFARHWHRRVPLLHTGQLGLPVIPPKKKHHVKANILPRRHDRNC